MTKKRVKKSIRGIQRQIDIHKDVKLDTAVREGNTGLAGYYEKEIRRLEEQLREKQRKLLPRSRRIAEQKRK